MLEEVIVEGETQEKKEISKKESLKLRRDSASDEDDLSRSMLYFVGAIYPEHYGFFLLRTLNLFIKARCRYA